MDFLIDIETLTMRLHPTLPTHEGALSSQSQLKDAIIVGIFGWQHYLKSDCKFFWDGTPTKKLDCKNFWMAMPPKKSNYRNFWVATHANKCDCRNFWVVIPDKKCNSNSFH